MTSYSGHLECLAFVRADLDLRQLEMLFNQYSLGRGHSDSAYILESSSEADLIVLTQRLPDIRRSREGVEGKARGLH